MRQAEILPNRLQPAILLQRPRQHVLCCLHPRQPGPSQRVYPRQQDPRQRAGGKGSAACAHASKPRNNNRRARARALPFPALASHARQGQAGALVWRQPTRRCPMDAGPASRRSSQEEAPPPGAPAGDTRSPGRGSERTRSRGPTRLLPTQVAIENKPRWLWPAWNSVGPGQHLRFPGLPALSGSPTHPP